MKIHLFTLFLLFFTLPLCAEQLLFKKKKIDDQTQFHYRWNDHKDVKQELKFSIANKAIFGRFRQFKGYQPQRIQRKILVELQKAAAKLDRRKINVNFITRSDGIQIQLSGKDESLLEKTNKMLVDVRQKTQAKYLKKAYYSVLTDKFGQSGIKPDHVRFASESRKDILPLTNAITKQNPQLRGRKLTEYILAFVQSIPYSTLDSRRETNGAGFSPPLRLINNNQGDCDSKVTLMANILNAIYPRIKVIIVYMPDHALIGVQMAHRKGDKYVKLGGRDYILAEPTGPAMLPFAKIAEKSEYFIDGLQFTYEIF